MSSLTPKQRNMVPPPRMTTKQAEIFWSNLTAQQKHDFALMYPKLIKGTLKLKEVKIDKKERILGITLEDKDKPSLPIAPFAKHFHPDPGLSD
jgi:hypothetical protein